MLSSKVEKPRELRWIISQCPNTGIFVSIHFYDLTNIAALDDDALIDKPHDEHNLPAMLTLTLQLNVQTSLFENFGQFRVLQRQSRFDQPPPNVGGFGGNQMQGMQGGPGGPPNQMGGGSNQQMMNNMRGGNMGGNERMIEHRQGGMERGNRPGGNDRRGGGAGGDEFFESKRARRF